MYIRKKYRELLNLADNEFIIPTTFQKFIMEREKLHNLIIKGKRGICWCTCCGHNFVSQTKVNCLIKCPNCKQKLLVKTDRLRSYIFKDNLQLLDKIQDTFVLRTFELYSYYSNNNISHNITEFMRTFIENNSAIDFVSDQVCNHMGYMYVSHFRPRKSWRGRNYRWAYRDIRGMVCPYGLKRILSKTDLKYSQLDTFVSKERDYINFVDYFTRLAHYPSFELLVKMKLFNLAKSADKYRSGKNFQEVFGVPKTFYTFIKKHNLFYEQLEVLRLIKKEDIKLINKLLRFNNLEELSRYVDLEEAYYKVLKVKRNNEYDYLDYLKACVELQYPMKDKKVLYPKDLKFEHDRVTNLVEVIKNEANDKLIKQRLKILNQNIYQDGKYIIFPAPSIESLIEESNQLEHCVKTYSQRYALAETDIYFLRNINDKDKPLVTIEVQHNNIVQARIKHNDNPSKEQQKFLDLWQAKILHRIVG